jgi:hypothetical protein
LAGPATPMTTKGIITGAPADSSHGWARAAFLLLLLVPVVFNAVTLWPELSIQAPSVNDDATHFLLIQRASEALASGENPIDHWVPELELGFPWFLYYQHLPHLTVVALHRLLLGRVSLLTLLNAARYALLVGFPLVVYWSLRRMGFSIVAASVAGTTSSLLAADGRYGFEYGSYVWRGFGMYTQLWAMWLSFVAMACLDRVLEKGKGYIAAIVALAALLLSHLVYAYMMALTAIVLLLVGLRRDNALPRIARLAVVGGLASVITVYMSLPFVLGKAYLSASPYLQRWKYDSYGAGPILGWLASGDLLDFGRLPVLTALLALGLATALFTRTRPARVALALFVVWLALYFGRPTWGKLIDVLPLHDALLLHRFSGGVHLAAIMLLGLGGEWFWRQSAPLPNRRRAVVVPVIVLVLIAPALKERETYYAINTFWMQRSVRALEQDADAAAILAALRELPPGRAHAGLRSNWGGDLRFGDLHFYDLLTFNRIPAASPPYTSASLNADLIWHFEYDDPAHYDLLDVKYLVAPRGWRAPSFLRPLKETRRYVLYETPARGYAEFAAITGTAEPSSQASLFARNRAWFQGPDPAAGRFVRYDFPRGHDAAALAADPGSGLPPGCPGGAVVERKVWPGRIDVQTDCPTPSTLVLKMTYHPNWRVYLDGHEVPSFMVSPSFIGATVPAGRHEVRAEYRGQIYRTGLLILGLLVLGGVLVSGRRFARLDSRLVQKGGGRG